MTTTARSSTRVKAAMVRREGLRDEGIKGATEGFWMFNFAPRLRDTLTRGCWMGKGLNEVTIKISTPAIYIVNTGLQSKC
jgi:hypothetical protein